jgi:protein TonB
MFNSLETNWDHSVRQRRAAFASFAIQASALSLLLALPLLTTQAPPAFERFSVPTLIPPPAAMPETVRRGPAYSSAAGGGGIQQPANIPASVAHLDENAISSPPDIDNLGPREGPGTRGLSAWSGTGPGTDIAAPPAAPAPPRPLKVSHWAEGNLVERVQPSYPPIARQVHIQGAVELRAIISKTGTIENLTVISGHPMLVKAALEAVRQWRYRPYFLNGNAVEVETTVTVNFTVSGN